MTRASADRPKPPKTISIGGHDWRVVVGGEEWYETYAGFTDDKDHVARGEILAGFCVRSLKMTIFIRPDLPLAVEQETLLHEVMHAAYYSIGSPIAWMDLRAADDEDREMSTEEQIIQFTSPMILRVLRENPRLLTYLVT
jgi:hypothetical protein